MTHELALVDNSSCECTDPGCPVCKGKCREPATGLLFRPDMEDDSGVAFCDDCGDDALASGVFR